MNSVHLIGNLTRDPEMRYTQSGMAICSFGLAINERVKRNEEWVDEPVFVDLTAFGRTAEVAGEYLGKGSKVGIEGKLRLEQWEKDGQRRSKLSVVVNRLHLLGSRTDGGGQRATAGAGAGHTDDGEIPF